MEGPNCTQTTGTGAQARRVSQPAVVVQAQVGPKKKGLPQHSVREGGPSVGPHKIEGLMAEDHRPPRTGKLQKGQCQQGCKWGGIISRTLESLVQLKGRM